MATIGGEKRENNGEYTKRVGLFVGNVIAVNPTEKEYKDILGMELKENSKAAEYLSERDGNTVLRVDFWIQAKPNADGTKDKPYKVSFFLEDKVRYNKDNTKVQYINSIGSCCWAENEESLPAWFAKREYREAYHGEEDLYEFLRNWLNKLNYGSDKTELSLDWKQLMKGNVKMIKSQIEDEWAGDVGCLGTVIIKEVEGEIKEYQGVYNRAFFPSYNIKQFRLIDFDDDNVRKALASKESKDLKPYERFVLKVCGEYGCKDFFVLKDIKDYDPTENPVATNAPLTDGGADY